jgi:hypothetical protein
MDKLTGEIQVTYSDPQINESLKQKAAEPTKYTRHFTDDEDFFLKVPSPLQVKSLPINMDPSDPLRRDYVVTMRNVASQLAGLIPSVISGLVHVHDPSSHLRPMFLKLFTLGGKRYVFLVRVDLTYRPRHHHVIERGTNDKTASYWTTLIFMEADLFPVSKVWTKEGKLAGVQIEQLFKSTFVGESGEGYKTQGVWLDKEITREYSKLVTPTDYNHHPYYPLVCKYQSICHPLVHFSRDALSRGVRLLHDALPLVKETIVVDPASGEDGVGVPRIEPSTNENWKEIRRRWLPVWKRFTVRGYFDDDSRREYELVDGIH